MITGPLVSKHFKSLSVRLCIWHYSRRILPNQKSSYSPKATSLRHDTLLPAMIQPCVCHESHTTMNPIDNCSQPTDCWLPRVTCCRESMNRIAVHLKIIPLYKVRSQAGPLEVHNFTRIKFEICRLLPHPKYQPEAQDVLLSDCGHCFLFRQRKSPARGANMLEAMRGTCTALCSDQHLEHTV